MPKLQKFDKFSIFEGPALKVNIFQKSFNPYQNIVFVYLDRNLCWQLSTCRFYGVF